MLIYLSFLIVIIKRITNLIIISNKNLIIKRVTDLIINFDALWLRHIYAKIGPVFDYNFARCIIKLSCSLAPRIVKQC